MKKVRVIRIVLVVASLGLLLLTVVVWLAGRPETVQANGPGGGNGAWYLPLVTKPFLFSTSRISLAADGTQGDNNSWSTSISTDGRYVTFMSVASNLVSGDTNGYSDIFVHDRQTGQIDRISVASDGVQSNREALYPSISGDGRYIVFISHADNLVTGDTNNEVDVFVHDQQTGHTSRVSVASDGAEADFGGGGFPSISADGRYVAFNSMATNLVNGDTNNESDVFVHDRQTGLTSRVSVASDGAQGNEISSGPSISADGRYVAFSSHASNLVPGGTLVQGIFVHDRYTGETSHVSVSSSGAQANRYSEYPSISADGRYVAFHSYANNLVSGDTNLSIDVFVHDRQTGETIRVSVSSSGTQGNGTSASATISADGRYVTFSSESASLVKGDTNGVSDLFLHDRQTGETIRISVASNGTQGDGDSGGSSISGNGRYIAFASAASNLVGDDTNGFWDVFVHDRGE